MLFLSFLSPVADGFISSSRLSPRLWSQSLSFERKHQSSKQWTKRPRSRSPLEVVSIYIASFRCKLHCPRRITRTTTYLSSSLDVLAGDSIRMRQAFAPLRITRSTQMCFKITPRLQPAYPRSPFQTIRSHPRYASSRSHDSRRYRFCPRVECHECKRSGLAYSHSARPIRQATKFATSPDPLWEEALHRPEAEHGRQKRFGPAYRFRS